MNVLIDLDGTLTDPREGFVTSISWALQNLGRPPPSADVIATHIGPPLEQTLATLLGHEGPDLASAVRFYRQRYAETGIFQNLLYPAINEALARLRSEACKLYLATSKPQAFALRILDHFGLSAHFTAVHGSEFDGRRSDKSELIAFILDSEGLDPRSTLMVGDRMHDMRGARRNGIVPVGVLWGYGSQQELLDAGAALLLDSPAELGTLASNPRLAATMARACNAPPPVSD